MLKKFLNIYQPSRLQEALFYRPVFEDIHSGLDLQVLRGMRYRLMLYESSNYKKNPLLRRIIQIAETKRILCFSRALPVLQNLLTIIFHTLVSLMENHFLIEFRFISRIQEHADIELTVVNDCYLGEACLINMFYKEIMARFRWKTIMKYAKPSVYQNEIRRYTSRRKGKPFLELKLSGIRIKIRAECKSLVNVKQEDPPDHFESHVIFLGLFDSILYWANKNGLDKIIGKNFYSICKKMVAEFLKVENSEFLPVSPVAQPLRQLDDLHEWIIRIFRFYTDQENLDSIFKSNCPYLIQRSARSFCDQEQFKIAQKDQQKLWQLIAKTRSLLEEGKMYQSFAVPIQLDS